jgi:hypothetical protein
VLKDDATFIGDITIPDKIYLEFGGTFTKTWRIQNSGDSTWTTEYQLVFDEGDQMGSPSSVPIPYEVKPGETIDISVDFTVPNTEGEYISKWMLQNAAGGKFGVGRLGDGPLFMKINAISSGQGSNTGGIAGGATITNITITLNQAVYSGPCPVTINVSGEITTSDSGNVTYTLDLGKTGTTPAGFEFWEIDPIWRKFDSAGSHGWGFDLTFLSSVDGTARLDVTGAGKFLSNIIGFSISCD